MKKIKGRYVATVIINLDIDVSEGDSHFREVKKDWSEMGITVKNVLDGGFSSNCSVEVSEQYKDIYELED